MLIQTVPVETLAQEPFEQTSNPNVYVKPDGTVLIIDGDQAYRVRLGKE